MDTGDDSYDEDSGGVVALKVESDEDDLDLDMPPTTGNQYLKRVRMEASGCPQVVVADLDTNVFRQKQTVHVKQWIGDHHPAPSGFAPSLKWQNMQVANFAEQRQMLVRHKAKRKKLKVAKLPTVPHYNDVQAWCQLCFGRIKPPSRAGAPEILSANIKPEVADSVVPVLSGDSNLEPDISEARMDTTAAPTETQGEMGKIEFPAHEGILPLVSIVVAMDQTTVIKVLEYHLNWFEVTGFTEKQGYWFYALLVCLDKPLTPDACSLLRDMARAFSRLRASLESKDDPRLVPLNLFICLIARYFDQSDLKDDVT